MAKTSNRVYGPALVATGPATIYTVPAVTKFEWRYLHVSNPSGSAVTLTLSIGADAAATRIFGAYSIPAAAAGVTDNVLIRYPLVTLQPAEIIQAAAGTNNILVIVIDGNLITL